MEGKACRVAVGSTNPVKLNAVRRAFKLFCDAEIIGVHAESGVRAQPIGLAEIILGALNRARSALETVSADFGVGVEAGAFEAYTPLDVQVAAIVDREGRVSLGFSPAFQLPTDWYNLILEGKELGAVAEERTRRRGIGSKLGVIGYLTRGYITRTELTLYAIVMALVPRLNADLYTNLPSYEELAARIRQEAYRG